MHYIGHFLYRQKVRDMPFRTLKPTHVHSHLILVDFGDHSQIVMAFGYE